MCNEVTSRISTPVHGVRFPKLVIPMYRGNLIWHEVRSSPVVLRNGILSTFPDPFTVPKLIPAIRDHKRHHLTSCWTNVGRSSFIVSRPTSTKYDKLSVLLFATPFKGTGQMATRTGLWSLSGNGGEAWVKD